MPADAGARFVRQSGAQLPQATSACEGAPAMPEIIFYLAEGRAKQAKQALMKDITDAVVRNFGVNPEAVVVQIVESSKENKSKGGIPFSER